MFFDIYPYLFPLLTGIVTLFAGLGIISRGWKYPQARTFAVFTFTLSMWLLLSAYMTSQCGNKNVALFIDKIIYIFAISVPAVVFHFNSIYSKNQKRKKWVPLAYSLMVLFWVLLWTPYFVSDLYYFQHACHAQARIFHHFYLIYFHVFSIIILIDIFKLYISEHSKKEKKQHQFIFLVLLGEELVAAVAFLQAYNVDSSNLTYLIAFLTTCLLIYAIFKHDLFELKVLAINIFIGFVVIASIIQIFIADTFGIKLINGFVTIIVIILGFLVVKNVRREIETREKGERLARYLANANARLRELDNQKTEFVSIASHQLRSPIAAIKGYAAMMSEGAYGNVPKGMSEPIKRILESGQRIGIMVDDFLNVTRIEQGRMTYDMKPQEICKILSAVVGELQVVANDKGLKLTVQCDEKAGVQIKADEGKIKQIFSNLIDNAIKYTQEGKIDVTVESMEKEEKVLVHITDTGIGIAPDEIQNLFQKFNRASNANDANVLGTGLGLYIAREIMKAHEGWIDVHSEGIGKGSTFTVELPLYYELGNDE